MPDLIEYILETSNDEKLPFLESIEAMSRSHRDDSRLSDPLSFSDFTFTSNNPVINYDETSIYTDCDLNILVDPKTGEQLLDSQQWSPMASENPLSSGSTHFPDDDTNDIKLENSPPTVSVLTAPQEDNPKERVVLIQISPTYIPNLQRFEQGHIKQPTATLSTTSHQSHPINIPNRSSPSTTTSTSTNNTTTKSTSNKNKPDKPPFSYSCLIAMALKDSAKGYLPVSDIYNYIINRFPYFKTAPDGWKNSIRHNLSLNKSFQKLETPSLNGSQRKACLWGLSDAKMSRFDEEIARCSRKADADNSNKLLFDKFLDDDLLLGEELSPPPPPTTPLRSFTAHSDLSSANSISSHKDLTYYRVVKFPKNSQEFLFDDLLDHNDFKALSIPINNSNSNIISNNNNKNNNSNNTNQRSAFRTIISNESPLSLKTVQASA